MTLSTTKNITYKQILYVFVISYFIYAIALFFEFQWIFTDEFFKNRYDDGGEYAQTLIALNKKDILPNFIIAIFVVLIPAYAVAACLWIGFNLTKTTAKFTNCLIVSAWANIIFPINYLFSVILRIIKILPYNQLNVDNNFSYQSVLSLMKNDIPDWLLYPLEKINVTEILFIFLLGYFISTIFNLPKRKAIGYAVLFYGCGLLVWIIFTVFLQFTLY